MAQIRAIPQPSGCGERLEYTHRETEESSTLSPSRRPTSPTSDNSRLKWPDGVSSTVSTDFFGFVEQSRLALQSLRFSFERERAAFAEERKLWEKERSIMIHRITELEQERKRGSSRIEKPRMASNPSGKEGRQTQDVHHVWEGSSPTLNPTRVFWQGDEEQSPRSSIHSKSNNHGPELAPSLDEALSLTTRPVDRYAAVGVPIELVDSSLDGITLKSTALSPDILTRTTSTSPSDAVSPSRNRALDPKLVETRKPAQLVLSELGPSEENLVRDAGHTPMIAIKPDVGTSGVSTEVGTLTTDSPLAPQQTRELGETYFSTVDEDPALQGPLGLKHDKEQDIEFLEALDQKLLEEARKIAKPGPLSGSCELERSVSGDEEPSTQPEPEPDIKFKHSTNFGSAFGTL
ncbi:conserved hypothetical protein [Histoplasma capsulatum var. duboisii H88]|uniref:Uncharacterized protein n=2 Tax=Ajellomyces capsulatus TaxID=5037 RepID=F0USQ8_AJEC8|nr:conserved hypothetical protein [Histoplasma capsulatum H143]EGC48935.1 conserved hypothetical protein [Histoplasma capsulatum var. duboisii H88]QSS54533.1 hypothetical protein I7I53_02105 [Histoplasma capsulatum var. duboisii H88]